MTIGKITKTEVLLLGLTGLFLCALLGLHLHDRTAAETAAVGDDTAAVLETAEEVPQETFMPDVSPLDLNTASGEELARLPGIGEALAKRIVEYREVNGPFASIEEIMEVSGIGEGKFADLKDRVTVGDEAAK